MTPDGINNHYRKRDHDTWGNNHLILGQEIHLSNTNKRGHKCDQCRKLSGKYPKWFEWTGWHDGCICFKTPILMTRRTLDKYNKLVARGEDTEQNIKEAQGEELIKEFPQGFREWVSENIKNEDNFNDSPIWITTNFESFRNLKSECT